MKAKILQRFELYDLIIDEEGTQYAMIHEGVTTLEEYPLMPKLFVPNDQVTRVYIPNSLESVYVCFRDYFPKCKGISGHADNPRWVQFRLQDGYYCSEDQPKAVPPHFIDNGDGTYTLDIPEGVCTMENMGHLPIYEKVTTIRLPASLQEIDNELGWYFNSLREFCVHPDNPHFTAVDGILFSGDKKTIVKYPRCKTGHTYHLDDGVEVIGSSCFTELDHLRNLYIGKGVRKIQDRALASDMVFDLKKIYIPPTVTELEGEIFDAGCDCAGEYYPIEIVGGARGSAIEAFCCQRDIDFIEVEEGQIDDFYGATTEQLRDRLEQQFRQEQEFCAEGQGYRLQLCDDTLTVFPTKDGTEKPVIVEKTNHQINANRRGKVQKLIIGQGITAIRDFAFEDYRNLKSIHIGPDVQEIAPNAFNGTCERQSFGCKAVDSITVDENNKFYTAIENVLYTKNMETLVKYAPAKPELYHKVADTVVHIGVSAFESAKNLQCLHVGDACVSIGADAFINAHLLHAYFGASVTQWPKRYPFLYKSGFELPWYDSRQVIGGPQDSAVQQHCNEHGVNFLVIEDDGLADFLATPLSEENDPYLANCQKNAADFRPYGSTEMTKPTENPEDYSFFDEDDDLPF